MFEVVNVHVPTRNNPTAWLKKADYRRCESVEELRAAFMPLMGRKLPVFADWETTSLNLYRFGFPGFPACKMEPAKPVGFSFSPEPGKALYVPVGHQVRPELNLPVKEVITLLKALDASGTYTGWYNYKYDGEFMFQAFDWEPKNWIDVMIPVYLENAGVRVYGLKPSSERLLGLQMIEFTEVMGDATNFSNVDPDDAVPYACADADLPGRMYRLPQVQSAIREQSLIYKMESQVCPVVREGMRDGAYLNRETLVDLSQECEVKINGGTWNGETFEGETKALMKYVGAVKKWGAQDQPVTERVQFARSLPDPENFNLNSAPQIGKFLVAIGVPIVERTDGGKSGKKQISTGKEVIEKYAKLAEENAIQMPGVARKAILAVVKYRELVYQKNNCIDKLLRAYDYFGPLVHFPFHHIGVPTGRMKSGGDGDNKDEAFAKGLVDMNVQAIPSPDSIERKPYLPHIRRAFVANPPGSDDFVFVSIDYAQIELRITANISRERMWIEAFLNGVDIHAKNAQLSYGKEKIEDVSKGERKFGKTMGFAVLYGASDSTVAEHGNIPVSSAKVLRAGFFSQAVQLGSWIESVQNAAQTERRVKTWFGRVRPLPQFDPDNPRWMIEGAKREAVNTKIQGSAADYFKIAIARVRALIRKREWQAHVQQFAWVHDELCLRVRRSMAVEILTEIRRVMEFPVTNWPVQVVTDMEVGNNWEQMKPYAEWLEKNPPPSTQAVA